MLEHPGDSEVSNLHLTILRHKDVLGLQISMKNFAVMDVLDGQRHLDEPVQNLIFTVANCTNK